MGLVTALRECLGGDSFPVVRGRRERVIHTIERCADELTQRGLPADALIRYGLLPQIVSGVLEGAIPSWIGASSVSDDQETGNSARWTSLLEPALEAERLTSANASTWTPAEWAAAIAAASGRIATWVFAAPFPDLIRLNPPLTTPSRWTPRSVDDALFADYRWCIDRFSVTSVADWHTTSIARETAWRKSEGCAPCEPSLMADRVVDELELEYVGESRVGAPAWTCSDAAAVSASLSVRMQNRAADLLQRGDYARAEELFRFALSKDPSDAMAANNLGFCLIPLEPESALVNFERAADLGFQHHSVLAHNRMVAQIILGREIDAIDVAEARWTDDRKDPDGLQAMLWSLNPLNGVDLKPGVDPRLEVAQLALRTARRVGVSDRVTAWSARVSAAA